MGKTVTKPRLGTIIHCWDHIYNRWTAAIVTQEVGMMSSLFNATLFRGFDSIDLEFYFDRENQAGVGGWRLMTGG